MTVVRVSCKTYDPVSCLYIWPPTALTVLAFTDPNVGPGRPDHPTGYAAPGTQRSFTVPDGWKAGRIWGRTDCDFSIEAPPLQCSSGGCSGGLECDPNSETGVPPATVAEWTLSADANADWYDGESDLLQDCPPELKKGGGVGCRSACEANLDGNQQDSGKCCSGSHDKPETCPPSEKNCPTSYAYAYDESSGTALYTCDANLKADYTVTLPVAAMRTLWNR
ncbi:thaumatin [Pterulicium gracile]|uniref:Thaumatin n=1 Tax=Pterulicium gracile TaxID=1884261 RepID=A0A5C3QBG1_9AGAR|nr:thaumatin [Pterula gracilis]